MSRFNPNHDVAPVLDAASQWTHRCLIEELSLFTDRALWKAAVLEEVRAAFVDNPDASDASFFEKLERQLTAASADAKCLMAELLWVLMLFQSNIGAQKKRESIHRVWSWSGATLDMTKPLLGNDVLEGIGNPGTAYNTMRWRELGYLIGLSIDLVARSRQERQAILTDRGRFEQWIADAPQEGYRQFRHVFRYLAFPDFNERITQTRDRCLILEAFTGAEPKESRKLSDSEQDDALLALRKRLEERLGSADLDFYASPLVERWRDKNMPKKKLASATAAFEIGYAALRERFLEQFPEFTTFNRYDYYLEHERKYKDELLDRFAKAVVPALASDDWQAAGAAAISLLTHPLEGAGNKPQNIVGWRYIELVRQLDAEKQAEFGHALAELFDETDDVGSRVDAFVEHLQSVAGKERHVSPAAQRSFTGFYLALWDPHHHLFLKTQEMQRAFRELDPTFQWTRNRLTGADVERAEAIAAEVYSRLSLEDWEPQDFLDVQGFLWVATAYGGDRVEEICEDGETMDEQSVPLVQKPLPLPPLNQILFGPPGTGKTFATIEKALEILDPALLARCDPSKDRKRLKQRFDEFVAAKRIRFVTFHQSFSYEDFVEGLRADNSETGQLQYRVEPGVFKDICDSARGSAQVASAVGISDGARIWKISIDGTGDSTTRDYCLKNNEARIGWGNAGDLKSEGLVDNAYYQQLGSNDRNTLHAFSNEVQPGDVVLCIGSAVSVQAIGVVQDEYRYQSDVPRNVIDDYNNVLPVHWLAKGLSLDIRPINGGLRFTQKSVYELSRFNWPELADVIETAGIELAGAQPKLRSMPLDHVLIIDEINRGNVSRIFGELITLIEPSKRAGADEQLQVLLPYSKKSFTVPKNIYLIGTMNTADRSLAGLDIALRRRFDFVEMPACPKHLAGVRVDGIDIEEMLMSMNQRIEVLLDRDHHIGHAYFLPLLSEPSLARLATIFRNQILPLLQEYFFEDWERIRLVLNDQHKSIGNCFVVQPSYDAAALFGSSTDVPADNRLWELDIDALSKRESYVGIYDMAHWA